MKTSEDFSQSIEDYLKMIYSMSDGDERISTNQIARAMGLKPASVTGMLQKLANMEPALVDYRKYKGVLITPEGERFALRVLRRHRLLETFLHEIMGFSWHEVHAEAHQLEHVISSAFEERMAEVLNHPLYDPHGSPIPTRSLEMPAFSKQSLAGLRCGQRAVVKHVVDKDPNLLQYFAKVGIQPGVEIEISEYSSFDSNTTILITGREDPVVFGEEITKLIFVELIQS